MISLQRPSYTSTAAVTFAILSLGMHGVSRFLMASAALIVVAAMVLDDRQTRKPTAHNSDRKNCGRRDDKKTLAGSGYPAGQKPTNGVPPVPVGLRTPRTPPPHVESFE